MGQSLYTQLFGGLRALFQWLIDLLTGQVTPVMDTVQDAIQEIVPEGLALDPTPLVPYVRAVNQWFPLDLAVLLFLSYVGLWVSLSSVRWFLRLIPGMG